MRGRYIHSDTAAIERQWHIGRGNSDPFAARCNVNPTTRVPILRHDTEGAGLELAMARWAVVPHWWKQPKPPAMTINARSEEAATKPMWRDAFRNGRWHIAVPAATSSFTASASWWPPLKGTSGFTTPALACA